MKIPDLEHDISGPIIAKFGGKSEMSRVTGHPYTRIDAWEKAKTIHDRYRPGLLKVAAENGIPHTPWDYIAPYIDLKVAA